MWGLTKKALNGTVGTEKFTPLDSILYNYLNQYINTTIGTAKFKPLDQIIMGQKTFIASDDYIKFLTEVKNTNTTTTFKPKTTGSIRVKFVGTIQENYTSYVKIYKDNNLIGQLVLGGTSLSSRKEFMDIIVTPDSTYKFVLELADQWRPSGNLYVCGTIVDGSLFE